MKLTKYTFSFASGDITVHALNATEAEILAKAEAIRKGWDYKIIRTDIQRLNTFIDWARLTDDEAGTLQFLLEKAQPRTIYKEEVK